MFWRSVVDCNSKHCMASCLTPSVRLQARYSISGQKSSPQKASSRTAFSNASSQKSKEGSRLLPWGTSWPCRWSERRQATAMNRIVGSECMTWRTMQAGQRSVRYQSCSSLKMQCSHAYALRASPRKARSGSAARWLGKTLVAMREAWVCKRNNGRSKVWMISRWRRKDSWSSWVQAWR